MIPGPILCDVCEHTIPATSPRVHCLVCPNYDLCSECALAGRTNKGHLVRHRTHIYSVSGNLDVQAAFLQGFALVYDPSLDAVQSGRHDTLVPTRGPPSVAASLPRRQSKSISNAGTHHTQRIASDARSASSKSSSSRSSAKSSSSSTASSTSTERRSTTSQQPRVASSTHSVARSARVPASPSSSQASSAPPIILATRQPERPAFPPGSPWGPFYEEPYEEGGEPEITSIGEMVFSAIFAYLDTSRSGYLLPEDYSRFLDDQGYDLVENIWKANLREDTVYGQSKQTVADKALRNAYDIFSIEYILKERPQQSADAENVSGIYGKAGVDVTNFVPRAMAGGAGEKKMPLLTLRGFIDIMSIELLYDPATGWSRLNDVLKMYKLKKLAGWGNLPRAVLPEEPDEYTQERVGRISEFQVAQGAKQVEANRARLELEQRSPVEAEQIIYRVY
ncbi:hypothetical protein CYLTODRAFT_425166 [Cylindrobasidium torrendii FP15055 ss-10]|uniref:ZZ-type domain-containing protein n=1 Tax=Cylindrobasidium torrendii FP15055 ss-10 TaxID=1314674 RepID=A0A0D7B2R2_9AGAR|nr:hypothetical protein CYLTODRAFT_425166 [Cylindrobasidium torrendii FP15055 ss-10]